MKPDNRANREEREPESSGWMPPRRQPEHNPLATGASLPAAGAMPFQRESDPSNANEDTAANTQPVPRSSWLPPGLEPQAGAEPPRAAPAAAPTIAETRTAEAAGYGRRTKAVEAYCRELFATTRAPGVADQILNSLSGAISEDVALLRVTRTRAAERLTGDHQPTGCTATPGLLAARANGSLEGRERDRLERHLASCLVCMAAERRAKRADMAFSAVLRLKSSNH